jgi:replicative DNA helicase/sulfur relay (sulfurtransferase) DsrC/TusE family protein
VNNVESKVLSAVLEDKQIHVLLQANVDNLLKTHNDIWQFIRNYFEANSVVPPVSLVIEKFRDFHPVEGVGATKHHLDELQTEYLNDSLKDILRTAASDVQSGNGNEALNGLITKTSELKKNTSAIRDIDATDLDSAVAYFEQVKKQQELGIIGIKTGLPGFDNYLPAGIMPGQLGVFLAYPGIGKSWLALYFAVQAWKQGKTPMIISLEMSETEVRNRVYTIMGEGLWSHRKISNGEIEIDMLKKWHADKLAGKPEFHIISNDNGGEITPSVLRGKIDQYKPDFVIVDYLQLMSPNQKSENETVRMKNLSRELKLMAIGEEIPLIAISSATPDDVNDLSSVPTLGQTSWSRQIAYDADWVMALGRATNSDIIECAFRKNRNGFMGEFLVQADFDRGYYRYKDFEDKVV